MTNFNPQPNFALSDPGPLGKTNARPRTLAGIVVHSAEGGITGTLQRLHDPNSQVSWHFSLANDGTLWQHYPLETQCWHAGALANPFYLGLECEGRAPNPLTPHQISTLKSLLDWLAQTEHWPGLVRHLTLFEHNEFMQTSCPSGRVPWDQLTTWSQSPTLDSPTAQTLIYALVSAAEFTRRGWNYTDLLPEDKAALRFLAAQI